jgi:hypothetical protein
MIVGIECGELTDLTPSQLFWSSSMENQKAALFPHCGGEKNVGRDPLGLVRKDEHTEMSMREPWFHFSIRLSYSIVFILEPIPSH